MRVYVVMILADKKIKSNENNKNSKEDQAGDKVMYEKTKKELYVDDRGYSVFDVFPLKSMQVNVSTIDKGVIKAFHMHRHQDDYVMCIRGKLLLVLAIDDGESLLGGRRYIKERIILSDKNPELIKIPRMTLHGYKALTDEAQIIYLCSKKYNPEEPDEERFHWEILGKNVWEVDYR